MSKLPVKVWLDRDQLVNLIDAFIEQKEELDPKEWCERDAVNFEIAARMVRAAINEKGLL